VPPVPRTPSLRVGSSGRLSFGGRKASFPQLGLLLVPSESALRTTPFLVFISVCCGVASAFYFQCLRLGRSSSKRMDAPSGNSPRQMQMLSQIFSCWKSSRPRLAPSCSDLAKLQIFASQPLVRALCPSVASAKEGAREDSLFRFLNTRLRVQSCRLVGFSLPFRAPRDTESLLRRRHAEVSPLRRW